MTIDNYQEFINQLSSEDITLLQTFAKNRVIEPFEGQSGLETLQETNLKLTSGINKLKEWNKSRKTKKESNSPSFDQIKSTLSSPLMAKLGKLANNISGLTKNKLKEYEPVVKELMFDFLRKGLELTRNDDYEKWIIKNATKELNKTINSLDQIRSLSNDDREFLVESLYPYRSKKYKVLLASFDKSVNVFLGAIVATNLPGTGILVSLVNMAKTVIRMSNRINSLAIIYGYEVENISGLFETCALILNSVDDWDKNSNHKPLDPKTIERLFLPENEDFEKELAKFIEAVGTKELYIAIPGIGMLSLGKINLDNLKIDLMMENIIHDYFLIKKIEESDNKDLSLRIIDDFMLIYEAFKVSDYVTALRNKRSLNHKISKTKNIGSFIKTMVGSEVELDSLGADMALDARSVFDSVVGLPEKEKRLEIKRIVESLTSA